MNKLDKDTRDGIIVGLFSGILCAICIYAIAYLFGDWLLSGW